MKKKIIGLHFVTILIFVTLFISYRDLYVKNIAFNQLNELISISLFFVNVCDDIFFIQKRV